MTHHDGFFCEFPSHQGDRRVKIRSNQFTKRVTFRSTDGRERLHERAVENGRRCRACVEVEAGVFDPLQGVLPV